MTTLSVEAVSARAGEFDLAAAARRVGRAVLTALAAVLFAAGWLAARTVALAITGSRLLAAVMLWCAAAVALGWREARPRAAAAGPARS